MAVKNRINLFTCIITMALTLTLVTSCKTESPGLPESFDYGKVENGVYTNDYFKMRVPFDTSWDVQSEEERKEISEYGKELVEDEDLKRAIDASSINNASLFTAYQYELGSTLGYNPSISIIAENVSQHPQVKHGQDYLKEAQKIMEQMQMDYTFNYLDAPKTIGNHSFDMMNVDVDYLGSEFHQQYMATITKGFCLLLVISYDTDEQREELEAMVNRIVFTEGQSKKKS
ncbi:hypothetical protein [uncultured Psychroserpens sp.]|uniref:hypothetical protein n=1 Tax=uncultured Psychroserpens sp. TaxID=255436 RepID=UPI00262D9578|nr:hypothetical protein [uncultured Psychroserpens sp.]